jgi:hypothetical protein
MSNQKSYDNYKDSLLEIFNNFKSRGSREDVINLKDV